MRYSASKTKHALIESSAIYLEMQVLAEGRWPSSAGLMVTDGIGWKPSSEAGRAGDPEIESTTLQFLMPRTDVKKSIKVDYFDKFSTEILNADTSQLV